MSTTMNPPDLVLADGHSSPAVAPDHRSAYMRSFRRHLMVAPFLVLFVLFFVWPVLDIVLRSFNSSGNAEFTIRELTLDNYGAIFTDQLLQLVQLRTVGLALAATLLTTVLGFPTAYLISRLKRSTALIVLALVLIPFWVPAVVRLFSLTVMLSPNGLVNSVVALFGLPRLELMFNSTATVIGMTVYLLPYMILVLYAGMSNIDTTLLTAARTLGASGSQVFARVYLPLVKSAILSSMLLVFILSLSFFLVPAILGGPRDQTVAVFIQTQIELYQWGPASALGIVLLIATLVCYAGVVRLTGTITGSGAKQASGKGASNPEPLRASWSAVCAIAVTVVALCFLLVPVLLVFPMAVGEGRQVVFPPRGFTLEWFAELTRGTTWSAPFLKSSLVGFATAFLSVALAIAVARYIRTLRSPAFRTLLSSLAMAPIVTPGILLAIGMFDVQLRIGLLESTVGLVFAHTVIAFPLAFIVISGALADLNHDLEVAAWTLGASQLRAFWTVTFRSMLPSVIGAFFVAFMTSWDDVIIALFQTGLQKTLPVTMYSFLEAGIIPSVPAMSAVLILMIVLVFAFYRLLRAPLRRLLSKQERSS